MASIATNGGASASGRRSVDAEISLVPFIDLLLCCVMFLLVTAVWNELGAVEADQRLPSADGTADAVDEPLRLVLSVRNEGYVLASTAGDRTRIPKRDGDYDIAALREALEARKRLEPTRTDLVVAPEDGVSHGAVLGAMDAAIARGFPALSLGQGAAAVP